MSTDCAPASTTCCFCVMSYCSVATAKLKIAKVRRCPSCFPKLSFVVSIRRCLDLRNSLAFMIDLHIRRLSGSGLPMGKCDRSHINMRLQCPEAIIPLRRVRKDFRLPGAPVGTEHVFDSLAQFRRHLLMRRPRQPHHPQFRWCVHTVQYTVRGVHTVQYTVRP